MSKTKSTKPKPSDCTNCTKRVAGDVLVLDEAECCVLCGRDVSDAGDESYWRSKIDCQASVIGDLLEAHEALSNHGAQSLLASNLLDAARCLVAHHDALVAARRQ